LSKDFVVGFFAVAMRAASPCSTYEIRQGP
jgi:hypothetical protein